MRRALLLLSLLAAPAAAHQASDFTLQHPGLSIAKVYEGRDFDAGDAGRAGARLAQGAILGVSGGSSTTPDHYKRLNADSSVDDLMVATHRTSGDYCQPDAIISDPDAGTISIVIYCDIGDLTQVWRLSGLERQMSAPPPVPGDIVPGTTDPGTNPPVFRPGGDGTVNVADVVKLLRVSVGLEQLRWAP